MKKLKLKEYKDLPDNVKNEIRLAYDYHKARKESINKKIENMSPFEYLNELN